MLSARTTLKIGKPELENPKADFIKQGNNVKFDMSTGLDARYLCLIGLVE